MFGLKNILYSNDDGARYYLAQLMDGFLWKSTVSIFGTLVSYLQGFYGNLVWGFLILFSLDFITGIIKSRYKGIPFSSKRLRDSVAKLASYMVLVTALIITSRYEPSFQPVVTITYYYMMFTELKSILENVQETGVEVPEFLKSKVEFKLKEFDTDGSEPVRDKNEEETK